MDPISRQTAAASNMHGNRGLDADTTAFPCYTTYHHVQPAGRVESGQGPDRLTGAQRTIDAVSTPPSGPVAPAVLQMWTVVRTTCIKVPIPLSPSAFVFLSYLYVVCSALDCRARVLPGDGIGSRIIAISLSMPLLTFG
jgi:hypothetical protein